MSYSWNFNTEIIPARECFALHSHISTKHTIVELLLKVVARELAASGSNLRVAFTT
jgi:hypothetical protein